jgi:hypothetical protein
MAEPESEAARVFVTNGFPFPVTVTPSVNKEGDLVLGVRFLRPHGEQPEPAPVSVVGCPYCQRVPCEDQVHALWRIGKSGSDV